MNQLKNLLKGKANLRVDLRANLKVAAKNLNHHPTLLILLYLEQLEVNLLMYSVVINLYLILV